MILLDLMGGVALLLWGLHMVHSGIVRAFGSDLRRVLGTAPSLLPDWYLGRAAVAHASRWRRPVVLAVIAAFVLIDAGGLCSTYGVITFA